ncbi:acyl carrier protein [Kitasatospora sp. NBC_00374]|uniref:acyl carrier protein n=1 Tax=unclassified Kitasatospora TaxID=2633591 RepID=UPI003243DE61
MSAVLERPARLLGELAEEAAAVLGGGRPAVPVDARFYDDLGFDSVMLMQLKYRIELRFPELGELSLAEMVDSLVNCSTLAEYLTELAAEVRP